jgi:hypothetical protein
MFEQLENLPAQLVNIISTMTEDMLMMQTMIGTLYNMVALKFHQVLALRVLDMVEPQSALQEPKEQFNMRIGNLF